ncbi:MAG: hypothetical protein G01um101438_1012 [Parcubacteria group bacterium Gr01-1014_38]|nr:MAG: hypothetical protein G01um101438_1012 [Parcubacteria group bacterium Gr01-1014_38]
MKDAASGDTLREGAEQPVIRRSPNGETPAESCLLIFILQGMEKRTQRTETSQ